MLLVLLIALGACSSTRTNVNRGPQVWQVVAAPPMPDYPEGNLQLPMELWLPVDDSTYTSREDCVARLDKAFNKVQRPVDCVASDDPRLKGN